MKTKIQLGLKYYGIGLFFAFVIIALIHIYSYLFDAYFAYAIWDVILFTTLISGIPFGFGLYILYEKVHLPELFRVWKRRKKSF